MDESADHIRADAPRTSVQDRLSESLTVPLTKNSVASFVRQFPTKSGSDPNFSAQTIQSNYNFLNIN